MFGEFLRLLDSVGGEGWVGRDLGFAEDAGVVLAS